jgi:excinuclease ABC subunit B
VMDDPLARDAGVENTQRSRKDKARGGDGKRSLFAKPALDEMGTSGDHATPAAETDRTLFRKQSARDAHGADYGAPDDGGQSLFRRNSLDEMTVRRTEKPAGEDPAPVRRERAGVGSYEDPSDARRQKRRPGKTGRPGR